MKNVIRIVVFIGVIMFLQVVVAETEYNYYDIYLHQQPHQPTIYEGFTEGFKNGLIMNQQRIQQNQVNQEYELRQRELYLKQREIELQEKELELRRRETENRKNENEYQNQADNLGKKNDNVDKSQNSYKKKELQKNWCSLKKGLSKSQVQNLLGKPNLDMTDDKGILYWFYENDERATLGQVYFVAGKVSDWVSFKQNQR